MTMAEDEERGASGARFTSSVSPILRLARLDTLENHTLLPEQRKERQS